MPDLSVCICAKNRSRVVDEHGRVHELLPNCLRSLALARRPSEDWEIVIADYESDDWPLAEWAHVVASPIPVNVVPVVGPFSAGQGLNIAARRAKSENLLFLSADMTVDGPMMHRGIDHLKLDQVYIAHPLLCKDPEHLDLLFGEWWMGTVFVKRAAYEKAGGFPEFQSHGLSDIVWVRRLREFTPETSIRLEANEGLRHQWHPYTPEWRNRYYPDWQEHQAQKEADWYSGKLTGKANA